MSSRAREKNADFLDEMLPKGTERFIQGPYSGPPDHGQ